MQSNDSLVHHQLHCWNILVPVTLCNLDVFVNDIGSYAHMSFCCPICSGMVWCDQSVGHIALLNHCTNYSIHKLCAIVRLYDLGEANDAEHFKECLSNCLCPLVCECC